MYRDSDEPRRRSARSDLRQALDEVHGPGDLGQALDVNRSGSDGDEEVGIPIAARTWRRRRVAVTASARTASKRILRWVGTVVTLVLAAVLATLIVNQFFSAPSPSATSVHAPRPTPSAVRSK